MRVVGQQRGVVGDRHHERVRAVLGLRAQVGRGPLRRARVRITQRSLGPGEAVDPDDPADLPLGLLHVEVAGADDHVDARHALGPVRERGDRLRAAHRVDLVGLAQRRRGEDHGVRRRGDDDLVDPGRARGHGAHQHRRRVRRPAAGRVDGGPPHGHVAQPHGLALVERDLRLGVEAGRRDRGDVGRGELQRLRARPGRARRARPRAASRGTRPHCPSPKRYSYSATAALPRRRTSSTIAATSAATDSAAGTVARTSAATAAASATVQLRRIADPGEQLVDLGGLQLVRDRVGDQARGRGPDLLADRRARSRAASCPVAVRSTIPSTSPVSGASSTEPLTSTISAWRPVRSK